MKNTAIFFNDDSISTLFAELVQCMGCQSKVVDSFSDKPDFSEIDKVITEPQLYSQLPAHLRERCLLVGNKDVLSQYSTASLSRPLTEEKIGGALLPFLSMP